MTLWNFSMHTGEEWWQHLWYYLFFEFKKYYLNSFSAFACIIMIIWITEVPMDSAMSKIYFWVPHKYISDFYLQKSEWEEDWCMLQPDSEVRKNNHIGKWNIVYKQIKTRDVRHIFTNVWNDCLTEKGKNIFWEARKTTVFKVWFFKLIFFMVPAMGLCFGYMLKTVLTVQGCFS